MAKLVIIYLAVTGTLAAIALSAPWLAIIGFFALFMSERPATGPAAFASGAVLILIFPKSHRLAHDINLRPTSLSAAGFARA
jgi:hypothetical protein